MRMYGHMGLLLLLLLTGCGLGTSGVPQPPTVTATRKLPAATPRLAATATASPSPALPEATPSATPTPQPTATLIPTPAILGTLPAQSRRRIDRTWNILFLGSDRRAHSKYKAWRTDAIMLIMIDKTTGEVAVVSIPRDLYIQIPGYKEERINAADYAGEKLRPGGGPRLLKRIFWEYFRVRVDNYIRLDIPGLKQIFQVLGPVEMCFPEEEVLYYGGKTYRLGPGVQTVDPETLYIYMTKRAGRDDIDRIRRQHKALLALRQRARDLGLLPRIPALYRALSNHIQTDLSLLELLWLARFAMNLPREKVHSFTLNYKYVQPYTTREGWKVLIVKNWNAVRRAMETVFDAPPPAYQPVESCP